MKLDHDCVRHLLLAIEENVPAGSRISIGLLQGDYPLPDVLYAAEKLHEAGYITVSYLCGETSPQSMLIESLTWKGHEFLDNIRDGKIWATTKETVSKFSSTSLSILSNVAGQILSAAIKAQIGL